MNGTDQDDIIMVISGACDYYGRKGDDHFILATTDDVRIDGGFGHDVFEFQLLIDQTATFSETSDDRTVIKIFEDGVQVQKIVLLDVEQIDWFMVG